MKATGKYLVLITAFLLTIPGVAQSQFRRRPDDSKVFAYHTGYNAGYRDGQRQAFSDLRFRQRFNYKTWDYNHPTGTTARTTGSKATLRRDTRRVTATATNQPTAAISTAGGKPA